MFDQWAFITGYFLKLLHSFDASFLVYCADYYICEDTIYTVNEFVKIHVFILKLSVGTNRMYIFTVSPRRDATHVDQRR